MRKLLPYYFKNIGLGIMLCCFILLFLNDYYNGLAGLTENLCKSILKLVIYFGALLICFSYQKNENKEIAKARLKFLGKSIFFGLGLFFLDSILAVIFEPEQPDYKSAYSILMFTIFFYLLTFHHELWINGLNKKKK